MAGSYDYKRPSPWIPFFALVLLMGSLVGMVNYSIYQERKSWRSNSRSLEVLSVQEVNDLRIITFVNSDSVMIVRHYPGDLQARRIVFGQVRPQGPTQYQFVMGKPGDRDKTYLGGPGDLLIGREQLYQIAAELLR